MILYSFDDTTMITKRADSIKELLPDISDSRTNWLNFSSYDELPVLKEALGALGLDPGLADKMEFDDSPYNVDSYGSYVFARLKVDLYNIHAGEIVNETLNFIITPHILITCTKSHTDIFGLVRQRLKDGNCTSIGKDQHYLFFYILKFAIIDRYSQVFEDILEEIEVLEASIGPSKDSDFGASMLELRKKTKPLLGKVLYLRNFADQLDLEESFHNTSQETAKMKRVVQRSLTNIIEEYANIREWLGDLLDIHQSNISNNSNVAVNRLTAISTLFMPLSFIAGIYGMNFRFMPEIDWEYSYPITLTLMIIIAVVILWYLRKNKVI